MNCFKAAFAYIKYLTHSKTKFSVHPPFIFNLYTKIILDKKAKQAYRLPEMIRNEMMNNNTSIEINDLGAGAVKNKDIFQKISKIVRKSAKSPKYAQLIYRIAAYFQPNTIIELGTSLGITTAYLAQAIPYGKIITIEGCVKTANIAHQNFIKHQINNIELVNNHFDDALPLILSKINNIEFVFFDGNHRKEPTLKYFNLCLKKINNDSVFIFDDIHWSIEMEEAWREIKQNQAVTLTIDLYYMGVVFFKKELSKQNFILKF